MGCWIQCHGFGDHVPSTGHTLYMKSPEGDGGIGGTRTPTRITPDQHLKLAWLPLHHNPRRLDSALDQPPVLHDWPASHRLFIQPPVMLGSVIKVRGGETEGRTRKARVRGSSFRWRRGWDSNPQTLI